jgi:hypothetical protein
VQQFAQHFPGFRGSRLHESENAKRLAHANDGLSRLVRHLAELDTVAVLSESVTNDSSQPQDLARVREIKLKIDAFTPLKIDRGDQHDSTNADVAGTSIVDGGIPMVPTHHFDATVNVIALEPAIFDPACVRLCHKSLLICYRKAYRGTVRKYRLLLGC